MRCVVFRQNLLGGDSSAARRRLALFFAHEKKNLPARALSSYCENFSCAARSGLVASRAGVCLILGLTAGRSARRAPGGTAPDGRLVLAPVCALYSTTFFLFLPLEFCSSYGFMLYRWDSQCIEI